MALPQWMLDMPASSLRCPSNWHRIDSHPEKVIQPGDLIYVPESYSISISIDTVFTATEEDYIGTLACDWAKRREKYGAARRYIIRHNEAPVGAYKRTVPMNPIFSEPISLP